MKIEKLKESYLKEKEITNRNRVIYEMSSIDSLTSREISEGIVVSQTTVLRNIRKFEAENPEIIIQMRKNTKNVTSDDYAKLKKEITELKAKLSNETLRADFYEEMVKLGKEIYGIDLKKGGTK